MGLACGGVEPGEQALFAGVRAMLPDRGYPSRSAPAVRGRAALGADWACQRAGCLACPGRDDRDGAGAVPGAVGGTDQPSLGGREREQLGGAARHDSGRAQHVLALARPSGVPASATLPATYDQGCACWPKSCWRTCRSQATTGRCWSPWTPSRPLTLQPLAEQQT